MNKRCFGGVAIIILLAANLHAQSQHKNRSRGFSPTDVFSSHDIDHINLFNGNLVLNIPIGNAYPVGGNLSYSFNLVYNSYHWTQKEVCVSGANLNTSYFTVWSKWYYTGPISAEILEPFIPEPEDGSRGPSDGCYPVQYPNPAANAGMGWQLNLGRLYLPQANPNVFHPQTTERSQIVYQAPDGSEHAFFATLHEGETGDPAKYFYSRSGSYLRLEKISDALYEIHFPNGVIHRFTQTVSGPFPEDTEYRVTQMRDLFGNYVNINYTQTQWTISDSVGRTHRVNLSAQANNYQNVVRSIVLDSFNGNTATYELEYFNQNTVRAQPHAPASEVPDQTDNVIFPYLTRIILPGNAGGYSMPQTATFNVRGDEVLPPAYDFTGEATSVISTGMIRGIILPTGATVKWKYSGRVVEPDQTVSGYVYPMVSSARNYLRFSVGVRERTLTLGSRSFTWKYDPVPELFGQPAGCQTPTFSRECQGRLLTNTVTNPEGDYTKHYFSIYPYPGTNYNSRDLNDWHVAEYGLPINKYQTRTELLTGKSLFLSSEVYARGGVKKRSIYVRYEIDRYPQEDGFGSEREVNARLAARHTTFHDDGDRYQQVSYSDFDGLGHYRIAQYLSNFGYGDKRIEITKYNVNSLPLPSGSYYNSGSYSIDPATNTLTPAGSFNPFPDRPWLLNTYSRQIAGDFVQRSTTFFRFNEYGQLTGKRVRKDLEPASTTYYYKPNDVLTIYEYSLKGNLSFEKFYGGDVQKGRGDGIYDENNQSPIFLAVGSGEYTLSHVYPTCGGSELGVVQSSQYLGLGAASYKIVDNVIDCSTGLVAESRDTAGNPTEYSYDSNGRITDVKPDASAQTHIDYVDVPVGSISGSPSANVTHKDKGTGFEYDREEYRYDQLGRISVEKLHMPGGVFSARYTTYNGLGWVTSVSEWLNQSLVEAGDEQEMAKKTVFSNFDPFGRPWKTTLPDNKVVQQQYSGIRQITRINQIRIAAAPEPETRVERYERYDQFGRLFQVEEPSATSGIHITTSYTHNVINKLTQASTTSQAGVNQLRTFEYDNLGNLTLERHPEKSGPAEYKNYDTLNNVGKSYDGQHWLVYSYDKGSRITKLEELVGSSPRAIKDYTYYPNANCPSNVGTSWGLGKICSAKRHNWVTNPYDPNSTTEIDVVVSEEYSYTGLDGRLGKRVTKTNALNPAAGTFEQTFTYHPLGGLAAQTYPQCVNANCANSAGNQARPWKVNYVYAKGVLRSVGGGAGLSTANANYASSITYNANQTTNSIAHANGVTDFIGMDPNNMPRVARMWSQKGTANLWDSGDYSYDSSGNITNVGPDWYLYDRVNRLREGSAMRISNQRKQRYTYDTFGNLIQIDTYSFSTPTSGALLDSFNPQAISAKNQISGILYDGAGNVIGTAPSSLLYGYDALNMMKYAPGYTYLYGPTDERTWIVDKSNTNSIVETYVLRGLNNEVLREYKTTNGDAPNSWVWQKDYIYAGRLLASESSSGAGTRHYHLDHLGTPRIITNAAGNNITNQQYQYFPFGDDVSLGAGGVSSLSPVEERLKFTGHEYSPDYAGQNLTYMHARFYKPGWGKFLSVDPGRDWDPARPQSWNMYTYVRNNPVNATDPTGRSFLEAAVATANKALEPIKFMPPESHQALADGISEAISRINTVKSCAAFLGGKDVALNALANVTFKPIYIPPVIRDGKPNVWGGGVNSDSPSTIQINMYGPFIQRRLTVKENGRDETYDFAPKPSFTDKQNRGVTILHELGHVLGVLPKDGPTEPRGTSQANTRRIIEKCYPGWQ